MLNERDLESIAGQDVYGADGGKIGTAGQVYVDDETGRPEWVTVRTGFLGANESFVPLADASVSGGRVTVPYDKDTVKNAPNVDPEGRHLDVSEEQSLYQYYGASYGQGAGYADAGRRRTTEGSGDDAMTVSEERLKVGREKEASGKVRLRKYVVTEQQNVTVPVTREEVRLEREPITEANVADATSGPDFAEREAEVTVYEERPVVEKEAVPVERVRLSKEQVTEDRQVSEEVRKERIDTEGLTDDVENRR
jgi:uncharacterized protein (TIGR02271 family)